MSNPRQNPLRIRRKSKKEFSRVASILDSRIEAIEIKQAEIDARLDALESKKRKRGRPKKVEKPEPKE